VKQVHEARIATDPNNCARYGDKVSDAAEPEEILDAEIVPADASAPPEQLPVIPADTGYTADGVPTFESVREKIETRYGTATGSAELASETAEGRQVEEQYEARQRAAHDRLEEIRAAMRHEPGPESGQA
jgi:hypothetical protein